MYEFLISSPFLIKFNSKSFWFKYSIFWLFNSFFISNNLLFNTDVWFIVFDLIDERLNLNILLNVKSIFDFDFSGFLNLIISFSSLLILIKFEVDLLILLFNTLKSLFLFSSSFTIFNIAGTSFFLLI